MIAIVACAAFVFPGCGGSSPPPTQPADPSSVAAPMVNNATAANAPATTATNGTSSQSHRQNELWKDSSGREYLGDVPLDVFYDQPLTVAANSTPLAGSDMASGPGNTTGGQMTSVADTNNSNVPSPNATTEPATSEAPGAANGDGGWEATLPIEVLDSEVTSIRNFLNAKLQAVGTYNSSMLMLPQKAAAMAVLAQIAIKHPGDLAWKEDANYIRDLAKRMNEGTLRRGKKDQDRLLILFENMAATFNRSRPAGLEEPPADDSFSDVAEMRFLMMRMAESEQRMKTEAGSESAFDTKKDLIRHEAALLATLTKVIAREEYGYGDDQEFVGYANKVIDAANAIRNSTDANDFDTYQVSLSKVSTSCQECHSVFKNN